MDTVLNDTAFGLVSHSLRNHGSSVRFPRTDEERLVVLRREFPDADPRTLADALERATRLEEAAIDLADAGLRASDGRREPTRESLAERFPGFSESSYGWAVNDGFILTRK